MKCADCGVEIHPESMHTGRDKWCEDCFEKGLCKDMSDHFDNFIKQENEVGK